MGQLTSGRIVNAVVSFLSSTDSTDQSLAKALLLQPKVVHNVTDGGTAGTAAGETFIWQNQTGGSMRVVGARITTPVAVTADNTNNAVVTLFSRTSAGASQATVAALTTNVAQGNLTAFAPAALTLTAANTVIANGSVLTVSVTKGGTGVAIGSATAQAKVEVLLEPVD